MHHTLADAGRQARLRLRPQAKITLRWRILARRGDGFHEVRGLLIPISLWDRLSLSVSASACAAESLRLRVLHPCATESFAPAQGNLVTRAAQAFSEMSGIRIRARIVLEKRIPIAAGLGGGSSDAAATLWGLNALYGNPLSEAELHTLAAKLGSDVPFFLLGRAAWVRGRGEECDAITALPSLHLLLVRPPLAISTPAAYAWVAEARGKHPPAAIEPHEEDALRRRYSIGSSEAPLEAPSAACLETHSLKTLSIKTWCEVLHNDFEAVLWPRFPELPRIAEALWRIGACGVTLSGSGATMVGVFDSAGARDTAQEQLREEARAQHWRLWPCCNVATLP